MEVLKTTKGVFEELGADEVGWINNGTLFLAHDNAEMKEFEKMSTFAKDFKIESHVLGAEEAAEIFPLLSAESFKGALYSPGEFFYR